MDLKLDTIALTEFLRRDFPQVGPEFQILHVAPMALTMQLTPNDTHLRPGGTVSGPTMFALADVAVYLAILAMIGPRALAVTTNCSIDFMRKPAANTALICDVRVLKLGKRLAVADAMLHNGDQARPVARASLTYALPQE